MKLQERGRPSGCARTPRTCVCVCSHIGPLDTDDGAGKSLQLSSREILHVSFPQVSQIYPMIKNAEGLTHFGLFPTSAGTTICGVFLTELLADDVLRARVVFPGQDGPY